ncbi:T9SS type A sorting domain-containing protein [Dyadobacter aurulentus]|uniref:T9SS type A sorting domain-containing protein n=1 Tax=Dyadobacter sp. UC 10 TaxID=2605428 RepID=UPI0011F0D214|nr:T9SS type A sorting domain-containing protein [Dyadobacter sp. UC 10]KAA0993667.1 T9SS type A sorting domain-containing protein [Dyadobacter sp. UC 10]
MKTYLIILGLLAGLPAFAQHQKPAVNRQDERIYFYQDEPSPRALIKGDLTIFPNPAWAVTKLKVTNMTDHAVGQGYVLQVHSTDGRLCHQQGWSAGQGLDVTRIPEGTYIVTVRRDDLVFSQKLIVKRQ